MHTGKYFQFYTPIKKILIYIIVSKFIIISTVKETQSNQSNARS